jgi:hypothetical protein
MPRFLAEVEFTFEAESLDAVGAELKRLSQAAEAVPAPPEEDDSGWTGYGPLIDDPR